MADLEEQGRKLLPEFHPLPRRGKTAEQAVECSLCCALILDTPGARGHHARFHASLWRLMAGVEPLIEGQAAELRAFFEEVDRG